MKNVHETLEFLKLYLEANGKYALKIFKLLNDNYNSWIIRLNVAGYKIDISLIKANLTKIIMIDIEDESKTIWSGFGHEISSKRFISNIDPKNIYNNLDNLKNVLYILEDKEGQSLPQDLWNDLDDNA